MLAATVVHLRFFAGARAATGVDSMDLAVAAGASLGDALALLSPAPCQPLGRVLDRCSFLVNAVATTDRELILRDGDLVDVMPPFAGG